MIFAAVPYCPKNWGQPPGLDLGGIHNEFFERLRDDDWGLVLDHDMFFTTLHWYRILEEAVRLEPETGIFTAVLNRGMSKSRWQFHPDCDRANEDMRYHREIGKNLETAWLHARDEHTKRRMLRDVTENENQPGGAPLTGIMMLSKRTWTRLGGFPRGKFYVDWGMHKKARDAGLRIRLVEAFYLFHWNRGKAQP